MTTTIRIQNDTKEALDVLRNNGESYDEIIKRVAVRRRTRVTDEELALAYREESEEGRRVEKEWDSTNTSW